MRCLPPRGWFQFPKPRVRYYWMLVTSCIVALAVWTRFALPLSFAEPLREDQDFTLSVVERESDRPIVDANLEISLEIDGKQNRHIAKTDAEGNYTVKRIAGALSYLHIGVAKRGFSNWRLSWDVKPGLVPIIPTQYTLRLPHGTKIGGVVQDDAGQPVPAASLELAFLPPGDPLETQGEQSITTGPDGRWQAEVALQALGEMSIAVRHPHYLYKRLSRSSGAILSLDELRRETAVLRVQRGTALTGRVLDSDGKPLTGADVLVGRSLLDDESKRVRSNSEGRFQATGLSFGAIPVTVSSPGFAPLVRSIEPTKLSQPLELRMENGRALDVAVVDSDAQPIEGVSVLIKSNMQRPASGTWSWKAQTDAQGKVRWSHAPAEAMVVTANKEGYRESSSLIDAKVDSRNMTMKRPVRAVIDVLDADTGKPIELFTVCLGIASNLPITAWQTSQCKVGHGGRFEHTFIGSLGRAEQLRLDAPGYRPAVSPLVSTNCAGQDVAWTVHLAPGRGPRGLVRTPDGKPLAGAAVVFVTPHPQLTIDAGQVPNLEENVHVRVQTDEGGRFELPAQLHPGTIIVVDNAGYAEVPEAELGRSGEITVHSWRRIVGTLVGEAAVGHYQLRLTQSRAPRSPRIIHDAIVDADASGKFVFERVPPGAATVQLIPPRASSTLAWSVEQIVIAVPAGTTEVQFGGGATVLGQVGLNEKNARRARWNHGRQLIIPTIERSPLDDRDWSTLPSAWKTDRLESWRNTLLSTRAAEGRFKFQFTLDEQGRFRIASVPQGEYTLIIDIYGPGRGQRLRCIATSIHPFQVSEAAAASGAPIDLGVLPVLTQ